MNENIYESEIFYNRQDIQNILHIGKNKATQLMGQKDFPSIKLGGRWVVKKEHFDEFINRWKNKEYEL